MKLRHCEHCWTCRHLALAGTLAWCQSGLAHCCLPLLAEESALDPSTKTPTSVGCGEHRGALWQVGLSADLPLDRAECFVVAPNDSREGLRGSRGLRATVDVQAGFEIGPYRGAMVWADKLKSPPEDAV